MADDITRVVREEARIERIKAVAKWHFRHFSVRQIADKLDLSPTTVQKYIALIKDRMHGMEDVDTFIRDVVARTMEELDRLQQQEMKLWEMLDWASYPIQDTKWDKDEKESVPLFEADGVTPLMKPRSPGYVVQATSQLQAIGRQRAELLKLIGNKVDINVNLQFAQKVQVAIMEKMSELAPAQYRELRREIEVMAESMREKTGEKVALPAGIASEEVIEADFEESYGE